MRSRWFGLNRSQLSSLSQSQLQALQSQMTVPALNNAMGGLLGAGSSYPQGISLANIAGISIMGNMYGAVSDITPNNLPKKTVIGPIFGYRQWQLQMGTGRLYSTGMGSNVGPWPIMPVMAICIAGRQHGKLPFSNCHCGYYALKQPIEKPDANCISGKIALWGKIIAHEKGYRAEYAYPVEIEVRLPMPGFKLPLVMEKELEMIGANYGCLIKIE